MTLHLQSFHHRLIGLTIAPAPAQRCPQFALIKSASQRLSCTRAVAAKEYTTEESKTYMDETFWIERPAGPRRSFDKAVLDRAGDAPKGAHLENMNHFAMVSLPAVAERFCNTRKLLILQHTRFARYATQALPGFSVQHKLHKLQLPIYAPEAPASVVWRSDRLLSP